MTGLNELYDDRIDTLERDDSIVSYHCVPRIPTLEQAYRGTYHIIYCQNLGAGISIAISKLPNYLSLTHFHCCFFHII